MLVDERNQNFYESVAPAARKLNMSEKGNEAKSREVFK